MELPGQVIFLVRVAASILFFSLIYFFEQFKNKDVL